jgi:NADPH-dependent 2,4-dienoyl-CoA reductase/sulfur reductase-like enzyme
MKGVAKMTTWHEYLKEEGHPPSWPYPIQFGEEQVVDTDVLVIGGGIAGCWAAISAARQGLKVALVGRDAITGVMLLPILCPA